MSPLAISAVAFSVYCGSGTSVKFTATPSRFSSSCHH